MKLSVVNFSASIVQVLATPGLHLRSNGLAGKPSALNKSAASNLTNLPPQFFTSYGSRRTEVRYGPFTVHGMMTNNGMDGMARLHCDPRLSNFVLIEKQISKYRELNYHVQIVSLPGCKQVRQLSQG